MENIIGRKKEIKEIKDLYHSGKAEFVAIYGRRRIGKTFLVDEALKGKITFRHAGLSPVDEATEKNSLKNQLKHFYLSLQLQGMKKSKCPTNWLEAFFLLSKYLEEKDNGSRQVIFLDELPWLDTPRSGFITAFEGFWNTWACHRSNIMLVCCGSANSWMLNNLVNNHGGLYGRTTYEIKLAPFTLNECEAYYQSKGIKMSRYDITQGYMIFGGIPYYLGYMKKGLSLAQNIDQLFFTNNAKLKIEYDRLFASVFSNPEEMKRIVNFLGTKHMGYTRIEISDALHIPAGGNLSKMLGALIASDFIEIYVPFGYTKKQEYYRLTDPFCLFYQKFVNGHDALDDNFWMHNIDSSAINSWRGIAFEEICFLHINQIKEALGIAGVSSAQSAWTDKGDENKEGLQIDMLIDRKDNIINMCEMKFYNEEFSVSKSYHSVLMHRQNSLAEHISKKKAIHSTLITTYGLKYNEYSGDFQQVVTLDDLFR